MGMFSKIMKAYEMQKYIGAAMNVNAEEYAKQIKESEEYKDSRYNEPKGKHKASEEQIDEAIESTEIYQRAKEHILKAQRGQIGYGLDKYPETLNADTWSMIESIDHIIDESVDKLHYLGMLRIQLEKSIKREALYADGDAYAFVYSDESSIHFKEPEDVKPDDKDIKCKVRVRKEFVDAVFVGLFQYSDVLEPSPMICGHRGGAISYPVAVVKVGMILKEFKLSDVIFEEGEV